MATFTFVPSFSVSEQSKPNVRTVQLGDGYQQRLRYGLNTDPKKWSLVFKHCSDLERDNILTFLEAHGGAVSFTWTSPRNKIGKYICSEWNTQLDSCNNNTISAVFEQVIEP